MPNSILIIKQLATSLYILINCCLYTIHTIKNLLGFLYAFYITYDVPYLNGIIPRYSVLFDRHIPFRRTCFIFICLPLIPAEMRWSHYGSQPPVKDYITQHLKEVHRRILKNSRPIGNRGDEKSSVCQVTWYFRKGNYTLRIYFFSLLCFRRLSEWSKKGKIIHKKHY